MKKFLSLVLALVMTMSLVTISAGAADYEDDSKIQYNEAVDVVSALKIVEGYADGSFNPTATLTRGAASKIICNLILGPTTASALVADAAPYKDVPADSTFAGYIAYCAKQGIISGYADGTFRPDNTLTGYAFMKMLLGALGYDGEIEGYSGANWSINVAKQALNIGLDSGLKDDFNGTKPVTREEACLYAFNTLKADLVEYPNKTTIEIGDTTVNLGSCTAKAVSWTISAAADGNIDEKAGGDNYIQFAEQYFNKLVKTTVPDGFGRPATKWTYKGSKVGTYVKTATLSFVGSKDMNEIYEELGMTTTDTKSQLFINGIEVAQGADGATAALKTSDLNVAKGNDKGLDEIKVSGTKVSSKIGAGTLVEVFLDKDNNTVDICAMSVYGGKISDVKDAKSTKDAYVVVEYGANAPATIGVGDNDEFETTEFAEDDVVAYTYSDKDHEIKTMYKMESVEGSLDKRTVTKNLTLNGTTYKYAKEYDFEGTLTENGLTNKSDYVVYLDNNGLALWIAEAQFSVDAYAMVLKIQGESNPLVWSNKALLAFADGTTKEVTLAKDYTVAANNTDGVAMAATGMDIVRYKVDANGNYKLTKVTPASQAKTDMETANKTLKVNGSAYSITGTPAVTADSKTIFVVRKANTDSFKVYTGIKNVPVIDGGVSNLYAKSGVAKVVFVNSCASLANNSKDVTFIAAASSTKMVTSSDTLNYYVYNAVVNGEITTVMVDSTQTLTDGNNTLVAGDKNNGLSGTSKEYLNLILNTTTYDSDDIMTAGSFTPVPVTVHEAHGVKKVSTTEIKLDTFGGSDVTLSVAKNVNVYLVEDDGDIKAIEMSDVKTNKDNRAYYTMEDGEITNLFIQEMDI